jgi:hypothetical protein
VIILTEFLDHFFLLFLSKNAKIDRFSLPFSFFESEDDSISRLGKDYASIGKT